MPLHEASPEGRGKAKRFHWSHCETPSGGSWQAYVAGRCHWYYCHKEGKTKPCLECVTGGELTCTHDHNIDEPFERGYMPLVRKDDYKPVFVIVYPQLRDKIDELKWKTLVTVQRGKGATDTVTLLPALGKYAPFTSTLADLNRPCDLTESLLRIWKKPALTEWYRLTHGAIDTAVSLPATPPTTPPPVKKVRMKSDGTPFTPAMQAAADKYEAPEADATAKLKYDLVLEELRKKAAALPNGKH